MSGEEKDANTAGLTFDEKRLFEKMNKLFGKNIEKRLGKLAEEYNELFEAFERYLSREKTQRVPERMILSTNWRT